MPGGKAAGKAGAKAIIGIAEKMGLKLTLREAETLAAKGTRAATRDLERQAARGAERNAGKAASKRVPRSVRKGPQRRPPRGTPPESTDDLFRPGPYADKSIPARGKTTRFNKGERQTVTQNGYENGCHSCGSKEPGWESGNFTPDHQPVSSTVPDGTPQRLYPHCASCSRRQGGAAGNRARRRK